MSALAWWRSWTTQFSGLSRPSGRLRLSNRGSLRIGSGTLPRFGEQGIETRIAVQGFQIGVGCDRIRVVVSESNRLTEVIERLIAAARDRRSAGEVIPGIGKRGRVPGTGRSLNDLMKKLLRLVVPSLVAEDHCQRFGGIRPSPA